MPQTNQRKIWLPNGDEPIFDSRNPLGNREVYIPPVLHVNANFANGTIAPFVVNGADSVVVFTDPVTGKKYVRGNIARYFATVDPKTGKVRNDSPMNLNLRGLTGNACDNWKEAFVRFYLRFDDADNRDENNANSAPKLAYFSDTHTGITTTQRSVWPVISPGSGIGPIGENSAQQILPKKPETNGSVWGSCNGCGFAYNGQVNTFDVHFVYTGGDFGFGYMSCFVNDCIWVPTNVQGLATDGKFSFLSKFILGHIRPFHANPDVFQNSVNRTGEKGGWEMLGCFIWDKKPRGIINVL